MIAIIPRSHYHSSSSSLSKPLKKDQIQKNLTKDCKFHLYNNMGRIGIEPTTRHD